MYKASSIRFVFAVLLLFSGRVAALELSIQDAETVAIQNDPLIIHYQARAQALMEEAVAQGQLPDPRLKLGMANVPVDSFSLSDEAMTQTIIGLQQMIPPLGVLSEKQDQGRLKAEVERAMAMERALTVLRGVRKGWMEVYYNRQALALVRESQDVFAQLVKITRYQYRAGRGNQQDVVRAQLELSLLKDRAAHIQQQKEAAIAELEKWTGASVRKHELSSLFPVLPTLPAFEDLQANVEFHPAVAAKKAQVAASRKDVAIARAAFKPSWMVDVSYGLRDGMNPDGSSRSDFLSAMVSVELPFFTGNRQDKRLNARGHQLNAAKDAVQARQRELQRLLDHSKANWTRLGERLDYYKNTVLPQAAQYSEASRKAYQSRVSAFSELVRARLRELEANLQALKLRVDRSKVHYDLQYVAGEAAAE